MKEINLLEYEEKTYSPDKIHNNNNEIYCENTIHTSECNNEEEKQDQNEIDKIFGKLV